MAGVFFFYRGPELFGSSLRSCSYHSCSTPEHIPAAMGHTWHPGSPRPGCSYVGRAQSGFLTVNGPLAEAGKHSHIGRMLRKIPFI